VDFNFSLHGKPVEISAFPSGNKEDSGDFCRRCLSRGNLSLDRKEIAEEDAAS
jgi:hypothetical protein